MDLLRWFRFLWAVEVAWDRATRSEARDFCRWLAITNGVKGSGRGTPYSVSVRVHSETVLRCFYDFHRDVGTGPVINPFPLDRSRRGGRAHAHHNPMEPVRNERSRLYPPRGAARGPHPVPAGPVAAGRAGARSSHPDGAVPQRAVRALPAEGAVPDPAICPG